MNESYMPCPRCGDIIKTSSTKCLRCGLVFSSSVRDYKSNSVDNVFNSDFRTARNMGNTQQAPNNIYTDLDITISEDKDVLARSNIETFTSAGRSDSYSQQKPSTVRESSFNGMTNSDVNDPEYFSTKRSILDIAEIKRREEIYGRRGTAFEFYRPKTDDEIAAGLVTNAGEDHDASKNPYENAEKYKAVKLTAQQQIHSNEYEALNLLEFTNHRFANDTANMVKFWSVALIISTVLQLGMEIVFDTQHMLLIPVIIYLLLIFGLSFYTIKKFSRISSHIAEGLVIFVSLFLTFFIHRLDVYMGAPDIVMFYFPVILSDLCALFLTTKVSELYVKWDTYQHRGELLVDVDFSTDDIKIYKSNLPPIPDNENNGKDNNWRN